MIDLLSLNLIKSLQLVNHLYKSLDSTVVELSDVSVTSSDQSHDSSSPQQSAQQDVCVQPQAVGVEGAGGHGDPQSHVRSGGPQRQDRGGRGSQRGRPQCFMRGLRLHSEQVRFCFKLYYFMPFSFLVNLYK